MCVVTQVLPNMRFERCFASFLIILTECFLLQVGSYVEQKAALAMTRLLSCGRIFEAQKSIGEDGYLYGWLEKLVSSANTTVSLCGLLAFIYVFIYLFNTQLCTVAKDEMKKLRLIGLKQAQEIEKDCK